MPAPASSHGVRRRARRRWWFAALLVLLVLMAVELLGFAAFRMATGQWFTPAVAATLHRAARGEQADERSVVQAAANPGTAVHPYLGFVSNPEMGSVQGFEVSPYGFLDRASPVRRRSDDRYVVGLTGGSFALQLGLYAEQRLIEELAKSPALRGRTIEVVRLGLGGYKQPQQLFAVQLCWLLGGDFDCLINLDGFNEVALVGENVPLGVPGWFPRGWARLLDTVPSLEQQRRIGHLVVLREQRVELAAAADRSCWSPTMQLWWWWRDRGLQQRLGALTNAAEHAAVAPSFAVTGPGVDRSDVAGARRSNVALWQRASQQLDGLCRQHATRYFHFLQPNQYVAGSKPIGAIEAALAIDDAHPYAEGVRDGYPLLQQAGRQLRADGVAFADLTQVLREHQEPLYVDTCCHLGRAGYEIVATAIAHAVRQRLDLEGFEVAGLEVAPPSLQLGDPLRPVALGIVAIGLDGRRVDVGGTGFGTELVVEPAGALEVGSDGALRARRRGKGSVTVRFRGIERVVPFEASWPDHLQSADGVGSAGAGPPVLRVLEPAGQAAAPRRVELGCADLPTEGIGLLAASLRPLPAVLHPGADAFGVSTVLLPAGVRDATLEAPIDAPAGEPLFLRVYIVAAADGAVVATSNTVVVTRG